MYDVIEYKTGKAIETGLEKADAFKSMHKHNASKPLVYLRPCK